MKEKKSFINRIYRQKDIKKVEDKINQFGVSKKFSCEYFMNFRLYTSLIVFVVIFIFMDYGALLAPIITVLWYLLVGYLMIDRPLKKRERKLDTEAYYYFEVLTLALESGRNLENAIKMACKYIDSEISSEFKETLKQVNFGKSLTEALSLMSSRIPSITVNNIILNMEQSNLFGNSIIETMYNQLDFLKDKQVMDIKEEINKIPNKISIFSVLFFIPLILLIILGPVLIDFIS
ncbi:MAG TPA: type II secretion system F family protein [Candidatus Aphodocola excrementigallinarum]|uniref:Type II secretion system F family protein n=1 Tax=Candidatus Aphodocola excrementigallinarum TaxID=2840670 RepID=A0A9D1LID4_9FIRM|nr:type II secretion system F family protein [Candidatus Aphodocola excrementigallinarum]